MEILFAGIHVEAVQRAFELLSTEEQYYLTERHAMECMTCGRARPMREQLTFEELGEKFEFTTAGGAEKSIPPGSGSPSVADGRR